MSANTRNAVIGVSVLSGVAGIALVAAAMRAPAAAANNAAKPASRPPVRAPILPKDETPKPPDVVAVFEGGKFGESKNHLTPMFEVKPDWRIDIEFRGDFRGADVYPEKPELDVTGNKLALVSWVGPSNFRWGPENEARSFTQSFTNGGRFCVEVTGDGVWKVTVRQGSGKL